MSSSLVRRGAQLLRTPAAHSARRLSSTYSTLLSEVRAAERVGVITLNRPKALNALSPELTRELLACATELDADPGVGAIVLTGSGKAFAAGADIKAMMDKGAFDMFESRLFGELDGLTRLRKPLIAAVNGFCLGGGCELAMTCDFILAAESAKFGQPEIKLGTIPGLGGTQRFTRALGKSRAMELVLTGDMISATEAAERGLAARVLPDDRLLDEAVAQAAKIASYSKPIVEIAKTCVNATFETSLSEGLRLERSLFYATFSSKDQKIGMKAFVEKQPPAFEHK